MKKIAKTILGVGLILLGVWLPFYIGSLVLPSITEAWIERWWTAPLVMTLTLGGVELFVKGYSIAWEALKEDSQ